MLDASRQLVTINDMAPPRKKTTTTNKTRKLSPVAKAFAVRMLELREGQSMTKLDLAARAGVSRQFIWEVEEQKKEPSLSHAHALAKALGATLDEMVAG